MEFSFVDPCGFPLGALYIATRIEAKARGIDIFSREFQNNRQLFLDLGIPPQRLMTSTPILICSRFIQEGQRIPIDVLTGEHLPDPLDG